MTQSKTQRFQERHQDDTEDAKTESPVGIGGSASRFRKTVNVGQRAVETRFGDHVFEDVTHSVANGTIPVDDNLDLESVIYEFS